MLLTNRLWKLVALFFTILSTGCATVAPYDYSALREASPRSIVVLPPTNSTVEVNAPYIYMSTISKPLAEKGYYVYPIAVIENFMKENGLPTPAEMNAIPLDKIREHIGADAVLYVNIEDWGQKYNVLSSSAVVKVSLKMVDTRTGTVLWDSLPFAVQSSNSSGGLIGALIGAIATQIAGSISDVTPQLSRTANQQAFDNTKRGLLPGPYAPKSRIANAN